MLDESRREAAKAGLKLDDCIPTGPSTLLWFPWTGTCAMRTIELLCAWVQIPAIAVRRGNEFENLAFEIQMKSDDLTAAVRRTPQ